MDDASLNRFEKTYKDGEIIFCEYETGGSKFYFVKKGEIKLIRMIDGKERMLDVLHNGAFFGEMAIIESEPRSATAVASGNVTVLELSKDNFETIVLQNPQMSLWLIQTLVNRIIAQQQRFQIYSYRDPLPRVIMFLFTLRVLIKAESGSGAKKYAVSANSDDIAKWVGISEKESRSILQMLVEEKLIIVEKDRIVLVNEPGLQRKLAVHRKKSIQDIDE